MKQLIYLIIAVVFYNCSSVKMTDSWRSRDFSDYKPQNVLIIGITENLTARKKFEEQLRIELQNRGIAATESYEVFEPTFTSLKQTEEDIQKEMERITEAGFDAVLISAVKGVDEKISYSGGPYFRGYYWGPWGPHYYWGRYYYFYQDVYFMDGYYNEYNVYHIEATLYNLKNQTDTSLVWVASYNIVNPESINNTVNDYVKAIIKSLEQEGFIAPK